MNQERLTISKAKILGSLNITSERTKNISKQIVLASVFKGGSIIANFLIVPLTINYLDATNYGLWLTITSFIGWFSLFDIGIGNGLRNKFAEARAKGDIPLAQSYISTAYFSVGIVCTILTIILFIINGFVDWTTVFNTRSDLKNELTILMYIVIGFFNMQLVVKLIITIYTADQKSSIDGTIQFIIQILSLIIIWLITKTTKSSLLLFGIIISALPVVILTVFTLFSFSRRYFNLRPKLNLVRKAQISEIFNIGISFFVIQISCILLYATANMIITHLYGPINVTPYNIAFKYFSLASIGFNIILTPYWSGITDAFIKEDFIWIKTSMRYLIKFAVVSIILIFVMLIFSNKFYYLWIGDKIHIPVILSVFMSIYFSMIVFMQPFVFFINGTGKIRLQLIFSVLTALINIPLGIFLAKYVGLGISGIILSIIICSIPGLIYVPVQYFKIINKNALGIWNK